MDGKCQKHYKVSLSVCFRSMNYGTVIYVTRFGIVKNLDKKERSTTEESESLTRVQKGTG